MAHSARTPTPRDLPVLIEPVSLAARATGAASTTARWSERLAKAERALTWAERRRAMGLGAWSGSWSWARAAERAIEELAVAMGSMPESERPRAAALGREWWDGMIDRLTGSAQAEARVGVAWLGGYEATPVRVAALGRLAGDDDAGVSRAAMSSIAGLLGRQTELDDETLAALVGALGAALDKAETIESGRRTELVEHAAELSASGVVDRARGEAGAVPGAGWAWLDDAEHPAQMLVRAALRRSAHPALARAAWRWLKHAGLAPHAATRLLRPLAGDPSTGEGSALRAWHLLLHPRRRALLRAACTSLEQHAGLRATGTPTTSGTTKKTSTKHGSPTSGRSASGRMDALDLDERLGLAHWCGALGLSARRRDDAMARLLSDPDPTVRLELVRCGARLAQRPACLLDLCFDGHARVAMAAASELLACHARAAMSVRERDELSTKLLRSPHESVRGLARAVREASVAASSASSAMGSDATRASTPATTASATARASAGAGAFVPGLRLTRGGTGLVSARDPLGAIVEMRRRGLSPRDLEELLNFVAGAIHESGAALLATPSGLRALASGVAALGEVKPVRSLGTLLASSPSLHASLRADVSGGAVSEGEAPADPIDGVLVEALSWGGDARVSANAIDALVRRHRAGGVALARVRLGGSSTLRLLLLGHASSAHHRVRGSAARGLILAGSSTGSSLGSADATTARDGAASRVEDGLLNAGRQSLLAMLDDAQPGARLAGLWLAERMAPVTCAYPEVVDRLRRIERDEGDARLHERARRASERTLVELRANWSRQAQSVA
jgi:hypothetical protein